MPLHQWSDRNESLNAFGRALQQATHGLIRDLSVDLTEENCVVVRGDSRSYYGVQLAIHAAKHFGDTESAFPETQLVLNVDDTTLTLVVGSPVSDQGCLSLSTHEAECRSSLTVAASDQPNAARNTVRAP